jgi:hypothetical protein
MGQYETYRAKPVTIRAFGPITKQTICYTHHGVSWAQPGDYIIEEPDGNGEYPVDPITFHLRWEKLDQDENHVE